MQHAETIAAMQQWCLDHYDEGADTMCECWSASDYADLFIGLDGSSRTAAQAWTMLRALASIYSDQQADARNSEF